MADKKTTPATKKAPTRRRQTVQKVIVPADAIINMGRAQANGFLDFIRTQGVVGLAVGLVLGTAVSTVTKSLVDNVIMPPLGLLLGSGEGLRGLKWVIGRTNNTDVIISYGAVVNDLINFLVIAFSVYLVFHLLGLSKLDKKKE